MNPSIQKQLDHRTIRAYKDEPLKPEVVQKLMEVAIQTATSNGMQQASIIRLTDPQLKEAVAQVCGQAYFSSVPETWIFIVDTFRNAQFAFEKDLHYPAIRDMDRFFQGWTDACLMAQNVVNAAESLGLGTVYFGSILNDPAKIIQLLKLPELTFPVVGLGMGLPDQNPQLKPRIPVKDRVFENAYTVFDNYYDRFADYDQVMQTYYDLRDSNRRVDAFTNQIVSRFETIRQGRADILKTVKSQGFDLRLD